MLLGVHMTVAHCRQSGVLRAECRGQRWVLRTSVLPPSVRGILLLLLLPEASAPTCTSVGVEGFGLIP